MAVDDVVALHKLLTDEVVETLRDLSMRAEGIVIKRVQGEMWAKAGKMVGRGVCLVTSVAAVFLLPAAGAGVAVGVGGVVVGYAII